jgi:REP-associated tyrosine transposase
LIPKHAHNFGTYFVTTQTWGRRGLFQADELAKLLVDTLFHYKNQGKYLLHEFVVMPNHFHAIITPRGITLERAMQFIKGGFSFRVRQTGRPNLEIWQDGYTDHRIRDVADYEKHVQYIRMNPVRARLCSKPEECPWSSAAFRNEIEPIPQGLKPLELAASRHG